MSWLIYCGNILVVMFFWRNIYLVMWTIVFSPYSIENKEHFGVVGKLRHIYAVKKVAKRFVTELGFEHATLGSAIRHIIDCAMVPKRKILSSGHQRPRSACASESFDMIDALDYINTWSKGPCQIVWLPCLIWYFIVCIDIPEHPSWKHVYIMLTPLNPTFK